MTLLAAGSRQFFRSRCRAGRQTAASRPRRRQRARGAGAAVWGRRLSHSRALLAAIACLAPVIFVLSAGLLHPS